MGDNVITGALRPYRDDPRYVLRQSPSAETYVPGSPADEWMTADHGVPSAPPGRPGEWHMRGPASVDSAVATWLLTPFLVGQTAGDARNSFDAGDYDGAAGNAALTALALAPGVARAGRMLNAADFSGIGGQINGQFIGLPGVERLTKAGLRDRDAWGGPGKALDGYHYDLERLGRRPESLTWSERNDLFREHGWAPLYGFSDMSATPYSYVAGDPVVSKSLVGRLLNSAPGEMATASAASGKLMTIPDALRAASPSIGDLPTRLTFRPSIDEIRGLSAYYMPGRVARNDPHNVAVSFGPDAPGTTVHDVVQRALAHEMGHAADHLSGGVPINDLRYATARDETSPAVAAENRLIADMNRRIESRLRSPRYPDSDAAATDYALAETSRQRAAELARASGYRATGTEQRARMAEGSFGRDEAYLRRHGLPDPYGADPNYMTPLIDLMGIRSGLRLPDFRPADWPKGKPYER